MPPVATGLLRHELASVQVTKLADDLKRYDANYTELCCHIAC